MYAALWSIHYTALFILSFFFFFLVELRLDLLGRE